MKKIVGIFSYPMDQSTRAKVFNSWDEFELYKIKWKSICYVVCGFETKGEVRLYEEEKITV